MEITIFKEVTTEGVIASIEENSKKYHDGLYANMNNLPERTMVKKGAAEIGGIIKELKTSRIKLTKESTAKINKEHDAIVERLVVANKPFTDLLDAYNVERKKILDAEKARKQAIEDAQKFENDHEMGLLINKTFEYDRTLIITQQKERDEVFQKKAKIDAEAFQKQIAEAKERDRVNEENARLANVEHVRAINRAILDVLEENDISTSVAKKIITLASKGALPQLTINY